MVRERGSNQLGAWSSTKGSSILSIGRLNAHGCNEDRKEIVRMMEQCRLDNLAITETKLRGEGEWDLESVRGYRSGGRPAKSVMAVLISKEVWEGFMNTGK